MTKWTGDLQPPPFWLNPAREVTAAMEPPKLGRGAFVVRCLTALLAEDCSLDQAMGVAGNTMNETGFGKYYRGNNLGGVKIWKFSATNADGSPRAWWRALGNKSSGDPQTCVYRAYASFEAFFHEWLRVFTPKVDPTGKPNGRYWKTGQQFWAGEPWFDDLIAAGYKGEVTRQNPEPSIHAHDAIIKILVVIWGQHLLGVDPDGAWGPKSHAACVAYQTAHGLTPTGDLDGPTLRVLFHGTTNDRTIALMAPPEHGSGRRAVAPSTPDQDPTPEATPDEPSDPPPHED